MAIIRSRKVKTQFTKEQYPNVNLNFADLSKIAVPLDLEVDTGFKFTEDDIRRAIEDRDVEQMRDISQYFFEASGIYKRLVMYLSSMLTMDFMVIPHIVDSNSNTQKMAKEYQSVLNFFDFSYLKDEFYEVNLGVIKDGVFYGYLREGDKGNTIQRLNVDYCRTKFKINGNYAVEFNVKYFDEQYRDVEEKIKVLKQFPKEIQKAYLKYKNGTLKTVDRTGAWVFLDPEFAMCFKLTEDATPIFFSSILDILNLQEMKALDKKRSEQELFKLLIQKMPLDKNGELVFDVEEAKDMHAGAVSMLQSAPGIDVLTTFAETEVANLQESRIGTTNKLDTAQSAIFGEAGTSEMLFDARGNLALDKSVQKDESIMFSLLKQFERWYNVKLDYTFNRNKKRYYFEVYFPPISAFNREEMVKMYRENATLGYPKTLVAVASGMKQSSFMQMTNFENNLLKLQDNLIPLSSSHTGGSDNPGREELSDSDKSDKTVANEKTK